MAKLPRLRAYRRGCGLEPGVAGALMDLSDRYVASAAYVALPKIVPGKAEARQQEVRDNEVWNRQQRRRLLNAAAGEAAASDAVRTAAPLAVAYRTPLHLLVAPGFRFGGAR